MSRNPFNPIKSARGFSKDRPNTYMLKNNDSCIIQENTKKSTRNTQMNRTLKDMKNEVNRNKKSMANTSFNNSTIDDHKPPRSSSQNANHSPNILSCYIAQAFHPQQKKVSQTRPGSKLEDEFCDENKQREMKYLMRIAALEKDTQKKQQTLKELKKQNQQLQSKKQLKSQLEELKEIQMNCQQENVALKKLIQRSEKKQNTTGSKQPSYIQALQLLSFV